MKTYLLLILLFSSIYSHADIFPRYFECSSTYSYGDLVNTYDYFIEINEDYNTLILPKNSELEPIEIKAQSIIDSGKKLRIISHSPQFHLKDLDLNLITMEGELTLKKDTFLGFFGTLIGRAKLMCREVQEDLL